MKVPWKAIFLLTLVAFGPCANAQTLRSVGPASSDTQYSVHNVGIAAANPGNVNTSGKTAVSPTIVGGQKTLIFIVLGQSLAANYNGTSGYTPTHPTVVNNFDIYNGLLYQFIDPAVGSGGTGAAWQGQLGDNLINAGDCARVIFIPIGIGSSASADWSTGPLYSRIQVAQNWARSLGWSITAVLWEQGQADNAAFTGGGGTSSAQYQANIIQAQNIAIGQGLNVPWLIAEDTMYSGTISATIEGAQVALVNSAANRFAGPNVDLLSVAGGFRLGDQTHLSNTGLTAVAGTGSSGWQTAIENMHF